MPVLIDQAEEATPGSDIWIASVSGVGDASVVFEDDGETGYFYAYQANDGPILDAVHIYNVDDVTDRDRPSVYKIGWSPSGRQALLLINGYPHAVFDFDRKQGWCRTGFPPSSNAWSVDGHAWHDSCLGYFDGPSLDVPDVASFAAEVAQNRSLWTIRGSGGYPALETAEGARAQPFWSSRALAAEVVATVPDYQGFEIVEISWEAFESRWAPGLEQDGIVVGINWSGPNASGYDWSADDVVRDVNAVLSKADSKD